MFFFDSDVLALPSFTFRHLQEMLESGGGEEEAHPDLVELHRRLLSRVQYVETFFKTTLGDVTMINCKRASDSSNSQV